MRDPAPDPSVPMTSLGKSTVGRVQLLNQAELCDSLAAAGLTDLSNVNVAF